MFLKLFLGSFLMTLALLKELHGRPNTWPEFFVGIGTAAGNALLISFMFLYVI
jgi:hypothetical protein